jgi:hypothetical protein
VFNEQSLSEVRGYSEVAVADTKIGDIVQFPRFGFCRLDESGKFILSG